MSDNFVIKRFWKPGRLQRTYSIRNELRMEKIKRIFDL